MLTHLKEMALNYEKFKPREYVGTVNLKIGSNYCNLNLEQDRVTVKEGFCHDRILDLIMDQDTFEKLADGTWTGITASARERIEDWGPLDFKVPEGRKMTLELMQFVYHLGMHLFSTTYPNVSYFGEEHGRYIHGSTAVPLVYSMGASFTYYVVRAGEIMNTEQNANPFPQSLTIISGEGEAEVTGQTFAIRKGMVIHIPLNSPYVIRANKRTQLEFFILGYNQYT